MSLNDPDTSVLHYFVLALLQDSHRLRHDLVTISQLGFHRGVVNISVNDFDV